MLDSNKTYECFPDLNVMRLQYRASLTTDPYQREIALALLEAYQKGMIEVSHDNFTGELLFKAAEIN